MSRKRCQPRRDERNPVGITSPNLIRAVRVIMRNGSAHDFARALSGLGREERVDAELHISVKIEDKVMS